MITEDKTRNLIKILIGAAWIDGVMQPEEKEYLGTKVAQYQLEEDKEIKALLSGIKPTTAQDCYQWLEDYLGSHPTTEDYQSLLEAISALIYSDGDIDLQEAKLLGHLQNLEPSENDNSLIEQALSTIRKVYQKAIAKN